MSATPGVKTLSVDNFLDADPAAKLFVSVAGGAPVALSPEEWASLFLSIRLEASRVPPEVSTMFDTSIGALAYGYFFYPLYALGTEQLFRVAEAAAMIRCITAGSKPKRFVDAIDFLATAGVVGGDDLTRWTAIRHLRNSASHANEQMLLPPGEAAALAIRVGHAIDALFR